MAKRRSLKRSTKKGRKRMRKSMKGGTSVWCCDPHGAGCNPKTNLLCGLNEIKRVCEDNYQGNPNQCGQSNVSIATRTLTAPVRVVQGTGTAVGQGAAAVGTAIYRNSPPISSFLSMGGKRKTNKRRR